MLVGLLGLAKALGLGVFLEVLATTTPWLLNSGVFVMVWTWFEILTLESCTSRLMQK